MEHEFIKTRDKLVTDKVLRCDDLGDLRIYTYTNWCKTWTDLTLNSRGVIYNRKTGEKIAHPFKKFFNMNERIETQERNLPWKDGFRIFKKQDGWLGILYRDDGKYRIATRGSFKSIGAVWATEFLRKYDLTYLQNEVTLLFEIVCHATHIVVDYGDREDLILLAAYNRHTGEEYSWEDVEEIGREFGFTVTESYSQHWLGYCRGQLKTVSGSELEGFVIRFNNGLRVKIKSEDYFRRSHLLAHLTPIVIWNNMQDGKVTEDVWNEVDPEYHDQLNKIADILVELYKEVMNEINEQFDRIIERNDRNIFAQCAQKMSHQHVMFAILDRQYGRVDDYVMKRIRPHGNIMRTG